MYFRNYELFHPPSTLSRRVKKLNRSSELCSNVKTLLNIKKIPCFTSTYIQMQNVLQGLIHDRMTKMVPY